jgi:hypothetical protein
MRANATPASVLLLGLLACGAEPEAPQAAGLHPAREAVLAHALARADGDADGLIQREEYLRFNDDPDGFMRYDTDGDGALGLAELEAALQDADPLLGMKLSAGPGRNGGPQAGPGGRRDGPGAHRQRNGPDGPRRPPEQRRQP